MCAETLLGKASNGRDVAQENVARKINPTKRYRGKNVAHRSFARRGENRAITGQGGGYAGRGLSIGVPEKIRGVALRATSPKHKVAPINQGSRTHTEESSFPQGMTREAT